jgi:uncharacterized protein (DUF302 family)
MKSNKSLVVAFVSLITAGTLVLSACGQDRNEPPPPNQIAPFSLSAVVQNATVEEVTDALANYLHTVDDSTRGLPSDWLIAGGEELEAGHEPAEAALKLPGGARIIEVCNKTYAKMAMSFGAHHGVALPCEISVSQAGDDVEVVMLDPNAIFGLFFTDVPADQAQGMAGLAATVRDELQTIISTALASLESTHPRTPVGPVWSEQDLQKFAGMTYSIEKTVAVPASLRADAEQREAFKAEVVEQLLETLTHEGMEQVGSKVEGLSVKDWRSARPHALGLPGDVSVVEVCSPTYAGAAMKAGAYHAPALPCQIAIWEDGGTVRLHLLDPGFIFGSFFADAPAEMQQAMGPMVENVQSDLQKIVDAAIQSLPR